MSTTHSLAGLHTFDALNIDYEKAYQHNPLKKACIVQAISLLPPSSHILDVGCGTGFPVSSMLSNADNGVSVEGFDISPQMIELAKSRIQGEFRVGDMLTYEPLRGGEGGKGYEGVFIIFSHLQLSYPDFWTMLYKYARLLSPNGFLAIGQTPADSYVLSKSQAEGKTEDKFYDETKTYVEDFPVPFMGEDLPTFMLSSKGQRRVLESMGLKVVWELNGWFQPDSEICASEAQQYVIVKREGEKVLGEPAPRPRGK